MMDAGLSPEQATEIILKKPKPEEAEFKRLQKEIDSLKSTQEQTQSQIQAQSQAQYDEAKRHMELEARLLVDQNSAYEPIKAMQATEAIPTLIEDVFHQGLPGKYPKGYIMSIEESAELVNDYLIDEGVRIAKLNAVQRRLTPAQEAQQESGNQFLNQSGISAQKQLSEEMANERTASRSPEQALEEIRREARQRTGANYRVIPKQQTTLSNSFSSSTPTSNSDQERRERAILAYQGKI
jgi:hypothetical protein